MAFKKYTPKLPRRLWALVAFADCGKSTFASRMRGKKAVLDTDARYDEVVTKLGLSPDENLMISDQASEILDPVKIAAKLDVDMPGSGVDTLIVDSLTGIIAPRVTKALMSKDPNNRNESAKWADKANCMRLVLDSFNKWRTDVLYIWHLERSSFNGEKTIRETLSKGERDKLYRGLNMMLEIVTKGDGADRRFGVLVAWSRNGESGMTLWDEPGNYWAGMPEKIEAAVYAKGIRPDAFPAEDTEPTATKGAPAGTVANEGEAPGASAPASNPPSTDTAPSTTGTSQAPTGFKSMADAVNWAMNEKVFGTREETKAAYVKVRETTKPVDAAAMFTNFIAHVRSLKATAT